MSRPTLQVPSIPITKRGRQGRMCPIGKHDTTLRMGALRSMLASKNSGRKNMPIALQYPGRICSVLPPLPKFKPTRGTSVFGVRPNALHQAAQGGPASSTHLLRPAALCDAPRLLLKSCFQIPMRSLNGPIGTEPYPVASFDPLGCQLDLQDILLSSEKDHLLELRELLGGLLTYILSNGLGRMAS